MKPLCIIRKPSGKYLRYQCSLISVLHELWHVPWQCILRRMIHYSHMYACKRESYL
jgi:hypothetical protein